jgi:hypothetical protein
VNIILPEDDDRDIALSELAGEIPTDILMDYGYEIMISSATRAEAEKKAEKKRPNFSENLRSRLSGVAQIS